MGAVQEYAALLDASEEQWVRLQGPRQPDIWGGPIAARFRADPRREMDDNFLAVASYVTPDDMFIDAGGGAGRIGLPMALRCKEVINVDPSLGMVEEFHACAQESSITNVRGIVANWTDDHGAVGDVVYAANVTYFVRDIDVFVKKLEAAARRRVIIAIWSAPNPSHNATLFKMVYGEEQATVPGYPELLPVLWEMGILPDVRFFPHPWSFDGVPEEPDYAQDRESALEGALAGIWLAPQDRDLAETVINQHFDELYQETDKGFVPTWLPNALPVLITWDVRYHGIGAAKA